MILLFFEFVVQFCMLDTCWLIKSYDFKSQLMILKKMIWYKNETKEPNCHGIKWKKTKKSKKFVKLG